MGSSVDGQLGWVHLLATVNRAAINRSETFKSLVDTRKASPHNWMNTTMTSVSYKSEFCLLLLSISLSRMSVNTCTFLLPAFWHWLAQECFHRLWALQPWTFQPMEQRGMDLFFISCPVSGIMLRWGYTMLAIQFVSFSWTLWFAHTFRTKLGSLELCNVTYNT